MLWQGSDDVVSLMTTMLWPACDTSRRLQNYVSDHLDSNTVTV